MYNTMNNPSAHPSYSHYYLLSPSTLFFVFFIVFLHILLFFCTSHCLLHISLSFAHLIVFCTSYCFALFYFIAHFILISPFLTICMPLCYVTYLICILIVLHCHWADLIRLHFTSSYALYNYYVTNKETLNPWTLKRSLVQIRVPPLPMVDNRKDKVLTSVFVWCCQNQVCNFLAFVLSFWLHGVWLGIRAFDCRSRGPRFKSGCPLCLWWTIEKTNFSLLFLFDVVKIKYAIYLILFWAFGCMGYGSVLEHLITDEEVPGSNLGAFLGFGEILK